MNKYDILKRHPLPWRAEGGVILDAEHKIVCLVDRSPLSGVASTALASLVCEAVNESLP